jgi:hypothetical protein
LVATRHGRVLTILLLRDDGTLVDLNWAFAHPKPSTRHSDGVLPILLPGCRWSESGREKVAKGCVTKKGNRWYAVIYEGLDPVTGKERRSWHGAGTSREDAERLAEQLAAERTQRIEDARSLTLGAFLTQRWLPTKRYVVAETTWNGYAGKIKCHVLPTLGKVPIRRLKPDQLDRLYDKLLHPTGNARPLAPKTVIEVHQVIHSALREAERLGIVPRNVALLAHPPRSRGVPRRERKSWTAEELRTFLEAAAGHRAVSGLLVDRLQRDATQRGAWPAVGGPRRQ